LVQALRESEGLIGYVRGHAAVRQAEVAGALRRRTETVDRVSVAVATADPAAAVEHFTRYPAAVAVVQRDLTSGVVRLANGLLAEVQTAPAARYACLLHEQTGSEAHRARLLALATERGLRLERDGLFRGRR